MKMPLPPMDDRTRAQMAQALAQLEARKFVQQQQQHHLNIVATSVLRSLEVLLENDYQRATVLHDLVAIIAVRAGASSEGYHAWCERSFQSQKADFEKKEPGRAAKVLKLAAAIEQGEDVHDAQHTVLLGPDGVPVDAEVTGGDTHGRAAEGDPPAGEDSRPAGGDGSAEGSTDRAVDGDA
jgi:hypothetical protein